MKPPPFVYHAPETVEEALALLAAHDNARPLAGGQSLVPMLNFRYAMPDHLIDLNRVAGLAGIAFDDGGLRIGAMTRQRDVEESSDIRARCPLLHEAILQVGHRQTRNRGTVGGSLCHLDPAAELPAVAMALDARLHVDGPDGKRELAMAEFPLGYMTPSLAPGELLTGIVLPLWEDGHGWAFVEYSRRHGDFAIVAAGALLAPGAGGAIGRAALVIGGMGPVPVRCHEAEAMLAGRTQGEALFREAAETCRSLESTGDVHADADYRRHLAVVLARRALMLAAERMTKG